MAININMGRPENESREHKKAKIEAAALFNNSKDFIAITEFPIIKYNGKLCPATVLFEKIPTFMQIYAKLDELNIHPKYILDCAVFRKEPFELIMDIEIIKSSPVGNEKRKAMQTECGCAVIELGYNHALYETWGRPILDGALDINPDGFHDIEINLLRYGYVVENHNIDGSIWRKGRSIRDRRDLKILLEIP